jgi:hypothetical protein
LGLSAGQLAIASLGVLFAFLLVKSLPGTGGLAAAAAVLVGAVVICRPVAGRAPFQWGAIASSFAIRRKKEVVPPPPALRGRPRSPGFTLPAKAFASGTYLDELPASAGRGALGVLLDEKAGVASAMLRARGGPFCLLDRQGKERRLSAWAAILESIANQRSSLVSLQWCQRAVPGDSSLLVEHLKVAGDARSPGLAGLQMLLETAGRRSWRHETLLVVSVRAPVHRRSLPEDTAEALRTELASLRSQLHTAGIPCDGPLGAEATAASLCASLVPSLGRHPSAYPWPLSIEERWAEVRVEGCWHRTYWVAEWPRSRVGPDFLSPLLIGRARRSFSVVMAPVAPDKASRDAETSRTAQLADAKLRAQGGFLETARHRRQAEAVEGRESELADGRGAYQIAGYVVVSANDKAELDSAGAELERAAGAARLCLRALYGQQKEALSWALPFGRGL